MYVSSGLCQNLNLTLSEWSDDLPVAMWDMQAVWMEDELYVGGGETSGSYRNDASVYIYTPAKDLWHIMEVPVYWFALTTYQSQLILVGGFKFVGETEAGILEATDKLWTLNELKQWQKVLPPMPTKRCSASALGYGNYLIVAGGGEGITFDLLDVVEVYTNHHWFRANSLPTSCASMKSTAFNDHWYLIGGYGQKEEIFYASLDSLIASCSPSATKSSLSSCEWERLPDIPLECKYASATIFENQLVVVGGEQVHSESSSVIYAYSPRTQSWVTVGFLPAALSNTCATVLPTRELMIIGGKPESISKVIKMKNSGSVVDSLNIQLLETIHKLKEEMESKKLEVISSKKECAIQVADNKQLVSENKLLRNRIETISSQLKYGMYNK